jgi:hypothetical protein
MLFFVILPYVIFGYFTLGYSCFKDKTETQFEEN